MAGFVQREDGLYVPERLALPGGATVFCDESGNSGPNYLDVEQPFFVLGGWLVPDDKVGEVVALIERFRRDHFRQAEELKAGLVLRNSRGKRLAANLFGQLTEANCIPLFLVAEKRYCIAGKVVETFLDPAFNPLIRDALTGDVETKVEVANALYTEMSPATLDRFAESYRKPTPDGLKNALEEVVKSIECEVSGPLARLVKASGESTEAICDAESEHWLPNNADATLNLPCLISYLMLIENIARRGIAQPIHVIHDEHHTYEAGYKKIFEMHRGLPQLFARLPHTDVTYSALEHVARFEMRRSHDSPGIQAADLLAGVLGHLFKAATRGAAIDAADEALVDILMPAFVTADPLMMWMVCSEACISAATEKLFVPCVERRAPELLEPSVAADVAAPPTPVFPVVAAVPRSAERIQLDTPLFAIVDAATSQLFIVGQPGGDESAAIGYATLFASRQGAEEFLGLFDEEQLTGPQRIIEFGAGDLHLLLRLLLDATAWTDMLAFDPSADDRGSLTSLSELAESIRRAVSRVQRIFAGGLHESIVEKHEINGEPVLVMQSSSGQFGALRAPDGKIYFADSKDDALDALRRDMGSP